MPYERPLFYHIWKAMMKRCYNPRDKSFPNYGGRGITVCERWHTFANFEADVPRRPDGYCMDRIDNNGNYELANFRWITRKQSNNNRRERRKNIIWKHAQERSQIMIGDQNLKNACFTRGISYQSVVGFIKRKKCKPEVAIKHFEKRKELGLKRWDGRLRGHTYS